MKINAQDFAEKFVAGDVYQDYEVEAGNEFDPTVALKIMEREAELQGIELANIDLFDYEDFFFSNSDDLEELDFD